MGMCPSKDAGIYVCLKEREKEPGIFMQKLRILQQEIAVVMHQREEECRAYKREVMAFSFKEAEWKEERKRLREEVKRLRRCLRKREEEDEGVVLGTMTCSETEGQQVVLDGLTTSFLLEQIGEERARKDEAVQRWKMLYNDIKNELDDLIQRTHQGGAICWREVEEEIEKLQGELKAKDETIQSLKKKIASAEQEEYARKREIDILRQSMRILSSRKK